MKKPLILAALLLTLSACGERVVYLTPEEAQARKTAEEREMKERTDIITRQLPAGCEFRDLGDYKRGYNTYPIFAVFCGQKITTGYSMPSGKTRKKIALTVERG